MHLYRYSMCLYYVWYCNSFRHTLAWTHAIYLYMHGISTTVRETPTLVRVFLHQCTYYAIIDTWTNNTANTLDDSSRFPLSAYTSGGSCGGLISFLHLRSVSIGPGEIRFGLDEGVGIEKSKKYLASRAFFQRLCY